jgi:hypothetical protein
MLWLTIKTDWTGIIVHHPSGTIGLEMSLCPLIHLLFADSDGRGIKATLKTRAGGDSGSCPISGGDDRTKRARVIGVRGKLEVMRGRYGRTALCVSFPVSLTP